MNFKTTLFLILLTAAGAGAWLGYFYSQPKPPESLTLRVLEKELTPEQVTRIKVTPPSGELIAVTFFFTDGREETVSLSHVVLQRLNTALPRPTIYGSGGLG